VLFNLKIVLKRNTKTNEIQEFKTIKRHKIGGRKILKKRKSSSSVVTIKTKIKKDYLIPKSPFNLSRNHDSLYKNLSVTNKSAIKEHYTIKIT